MKFENTMALFIDGANFYATAKALGFDVVITLREDAA